MTDKPLMPWVVVGSQGVYWLGHSRDEEGAWDIALGWPDQQEIDLRKQEGWYAAEATVTWRKP